MFLPLNGIHISDFSSAILTRLDKIQKLWCVSQASQSIKMTLQWLSHLRLLLCNGCTSRIKPLQKACFHILFQVYIISIWAIYKGPFKVAYTSGRKCLYSLVNYFYRNFECILMKPHINFFQKWAAVGRFPYHFLSHDHVNINIRPYGENTKIPFSKLLK